jgi:hypothetical protein
VSGLFPGSVEGVVTKQNRPVEGMTVSLDDALAEGETDSAGAFVLKGVRPGLRRLSVSSGQKVYFTRQFEMRGRLVDLKTIDIDQQTIHVSQLGGESFPTPEVKPPTPTPSPTPSTAGRAPAGLIDPAILFAGTAQLEHSWRPRNAADPAVWQNPWVVSIWVKGNQQTLASIASVTYMLHPTFNPNVVSRFDPRDAFRLDLNVWGKFEIKARVNYRDGQSVELTRYLQ